MERAEAVYIIFQANPIYQMSQHYGTERSEEELNQWNRVSERYVASQTPEDRMVRIYL